MKDLDFGRGHADGAGELGTEAENGGGGLPDAGRGAAPFGEEIAAAGGVTASAATIPAAPAFQRRPAPWRELARLISRSVVMGPPSAPGPGDRNTTIREHGSRAVCDRL